MNKEQDLSKFNIHTDLIIDDNKLLDKYVQKTIYDDITVSEVKVDKSSSGELGKKEGNYITIEFNDITDSDNQKKVGNILEKYLKKMLDIMHLKEDDDCLIIGLGNSKSTPDSLGPKVIDNIIITRHLFEMGKMSSNYRSVASLTPGVMGTTGIETTDLIRGVITKIKPKFVIAIDALASTSIDRINTTIQMTDTGIHPGSGVGNHRKEISKETLNIPVLAIGIPTVVESSLIVRDTLTYLFKHITYTKNNYNMSKLTYFHKNYKDKLQDLKLDKEDEEHLLGLVGSLSESEKYALIKEVLEALDYNLMVCPKEIDFLIDKLSNLLATSLNNSLHRQIN